MTSWRPCDRKTSRAEAAGPCSPSRAGTRGQGGRPGNPAQKGGTPMLATYLQVVLSGLAVGGIYALVALSFSITFTTTKTLNFAQGVFIGIGAFRGVAALAVLSGKGAFASLEPDASTGGTYTTAAIAVGVAMGVLGLLLFVTAVRPFAG